MSKLEIALAASTLLLTVTLVFASRRLKKTRTKRRGIHTEEKRSLISRIGVMNLILIIVALSLLTFTIVMIELFKIYGQIPDTLVTSVFVALGGECGIMGWIKTSKDKNQNRQWELEDKKNAQEQAAKAPPPATIESEHPRNEL